MFKHPYIVVIRKIKDNIQSCTEVEQAITLSPAKVVTATDHFHLSDILDMSYKPFSGSSGILYLHTIRGLYSYHTKQNPESFISTYRQLKKKC